MDSWDQQFHPNWRPLATTHFHLKRFVRETCNEMDKHHTTIRLEKHNLKLISGEEIQEFYKNLIEKENPGHRKNREKVTSGKTKEAALLKNFNSQKFFRCAIENKAKDLQSFNYREGNINVQDMYGWTALMMAVCAGAFEAVQILIKLGIDVNIKDKSGKTAGDLAKAKGYFHIVQFLENKIPTSNNEKEGTKEKILNVMPEPFYCVICQMSFKETPKYKHETSTIHQFNLKSTIPPNKLQKFNIPPRNKGLQLMVKQGWDKESGLGPVKKGRLYPIKTTIRKQRSGLGIEQQPARITHFMAHGLKDSVGNSSLLKTIYKRSRNDMRSEKRMEWRRERRLRRELS